MYFRKLLFAQLMVLAAVAFLYIIGLLLYLHWTFWWYDILLHFLGGLWVALATIAAVVYYGREPKIFHVFLGIMVVGVAWEIFEFIVGVPREANYAFDTLIDLVMDLVGSITGFLLTRFILVPTEEHDTITPRVR